MRNKRDGELVNLSFQMKFIFLTPSCKIPRGAQYLDPTIYAVYLPINISWNASKVEASLFFNCDETLIASSQAVVTARFQLL